MFDPIESLVVCSTRERVWSCVRPEREFGRVLDPRESLVVCSTRERVWSCVRPEREFGRVFDPRESLVVCSTQESLVMCSTRERVSSCVGPEKEFGRVRPEKEFPPEKEFGRVFDLIENLVLCLTSVFIVLKRIFLSFRSSKFLHSFSYFHSGERRRRHSLLEKRTCGYLPVTRRWIC